MKMYSEFSEWYTLLTPLEEYEEEAGYFLSLFKSALKDLPTRPRLLELGAGAGHNAFYMAEDFELYLTDLSPEMLAIAQRTCPTATCSVGDMRSLRLNQSFDAVFIHDAIVYMVTEDDLRAALTTARIHLKPGGVLLIAPDCVAETYAPEEDCGGSDRGDRGMRYLGWSWKTDEVPPRYFTDYTLVTRVGYGQPVVHQDRQQEGVFPRAVWVQLLEEAGFSVQSFQWQHSEVDYPLDIFLARRA